MIAARTNDGRGGPFTPVIGTTPGVWRPTPPPFASDPAPWVGNVRPFLVPNVRMLRSAGPNPLTSRAYAKDLNEVKAIGALHSTTRTPDETDAAIFWQDHAFALWNRVFRSLAADAPSRHRRQRAAAGHHQPGRRRRGDRLLEQQIPLQLLAPDHRHPRGRHRRQPRHHRRPHMDAAV